MDITATMRVATIHPCSESNSQLHVRKRLDTKYVHHPRISATSDKTINTESRVENSTSVMGMNRIIVEKLSGENIYCLELFESSERTRLLKSS